jgi:hypothetical protein
VVDSPHVGVRMREHRVFRLQLRLTDDLGYNRLLGAESGQWVAAAQYEATRSGPLAVPSFDIVGFFTTRPGLPRPDAQSRSRRSRRSRSNPAGRWPWRPDPA